MIIRIIIFFLMLLFTVSGFAETVKVGDEVVFGRYEQDNDASNGPEPVAWRVLSVEGDEALLISRYILDARAYNDRGGLASWVSSSLRAWLNDAFYQTAFTYADQSLIVTKTMKNWRESDTTDAVFLLDNDQAKQLFADHKDRMGKATAFAEGRWIYMSQDFGPGNVHWWLRTISWESADMASFVATSGGVMTCGGELLGRTDNPRLGVRPCIWINLAGYQQDPNLKAYQKTLKVLITSQNTVNVREKPDSSSARKGCATPGKTYLLLSKAENGWFEIQIENGVTGFVSPKMAEVVE